ncbi:uncharacterized protein ATNIH1004_008250 [Aspergillus tanneri]|uniref:Uncharacterized protein n=1 Tax=Aspergillus tanneri TaxID=1220188 RepID=A0A5M9MGF4_9EURO|nr:uncharacterized protein ATNIH1004_008250 [Aspergillus tanneri]KAA8644053.1 hypothetical protein ATNIH1004_008250 [Aspergillus tanneri]
MRVVAVFAALLTLAYAAPSLEARQQGEKCISISPTPVAPTAESSVTVQALFSFAANVAIKPVSIGKGTTM